MAELKSLTMGGSTYDSFCDKEAREAVEALAEDMPNDDHINDLINSALGVIENGSY